MKHKVSELEGALLDAAVAIALGAEVISWVHANRIPADGGYWVECDKDVVGERRARLKAPPSMEPVCDSFSDDWSEGGDIIERERISLLFVHQDNWLASCAGFEHYEQSGPMPLVAAMRAFVASRHGLEIELPD